MSYVLGNLPQDQKGFQTFIVNELRKLEETFRAGNFTSGGSDGSSSGTSALLVPGLRLSLTANTAVTSADVSGAGTVYAVRTGYNTISLYNGTAWVSHTLSADLSLILDSTGHAATKEYSVFAALDGSTVKLGTGPAWSTSTSVGTGSGTSETEFYDGREVNKYDITLRNNSSTFSVSARQALLLGGFATTSIAGQTEDSLTKRLLSNVYNATRRAMRRIDSTDSWSGSATDAWRQANGSTLNQLEFFSVNGVYPVSAFANGLVINSTSTVRTAGTGIGLDSTSATATGSFKETLAVHNEHVFPLKASYNGYPGIGRHTLKWLELSGTADTRTWYGDLNFPDRVQTGIFGEVIA